MGVTMVDEALTKLSSVSRLYKEVEAPGRSGLDQRAVNMAHKLAEMVSKLAEALRITRCLAEERCGELSEGRVCSGPGRLTVTVFPDQFIAVRRTDVKMLAYDDHDGEWHAVFMVGGKLKFSVTSTVLRMCRDGKCMDVPPDAGHIKQNYSDVRYYSGELDAVLSKVLEGLR
ncbi:MAG: hypothetical protein QI199_07670, partial [Candidatus Korarchaeota archaeon]|nr:hypothetical protein [Candidatus Korarchaeota archaeon]